MEPDQGRLSAKQIEEIGSVLVREARRAKAANPDLVVSMPNTTDMERDLQAVAGALTGALTPGAIAVSGHPYQPRDTFLAIREVANQLYLEALNATQS
ncbi:MAG: hypothetical protein ACFB0C_15620 [Leptolyngbyaceae cyanobacterium]